MEELPYKPQQIQEVLEEVVVIMEQEEQEILHRQVRHKVMQVEDQVLQEIHSQEQVVEELHK